jgi:bifunctional DNA-binding transcriptional regulator/antitoxin component of YhaV-PrlF toxin-antitoxin module
MGETIFRGGKVQKGDRIKIPKAIVDTLSLKPGRKITIKFDADKKTFIVEEEKKK